MTRISNGLNEQSFFNDRFIHEAVVLLPASLPTNRRFRPFIAGVMPGGKDICACFNALQKRYGDGITAHTLSECRRQCVTLPCSDKDEMGILANKLRKDVAELLGVPAVVLTDGGYMTVCHRINMPIMAFRTV